MLWWQSSGRMGSRGRKRGGPGMNAQLKTGILVASLVAVAVLASLAKRSDVYLLTLFCVYLMATFGLNLTVGYAGQMSLGQAAFFGIGAYIGAIGAACAGIGGVYYASLVEFIEPGPFHFSTSLTMLLAVIVGGSGRFFGPVVGTIIIILLPELLRSTNVSWLKFMQTWYLAVFGVAVVALMIWLPGGILSIGDRFKSKGAAR